MHILITLILLALGAVLLLGGHLGRSQARWEQLNAEHANEKESPAEAAESHQLAA